ncbi:MAG TPA: TIGR00730 family Rossman fold protein [Bordetella sp.]|uniref:LOG family protein n=1 Tax=Bordetella sp. BOR01 TaxID=2854779 RepID=UPI001C4636FE|nr:TIGR00730 family Rossman fold protein [Bordetella sp. BOR01]MBV7485564.1 TIGR00730 family Rossman fold protein [Bordetella sp. BOR01]HYG41481.1 TIGR00730 family Rossman fold protein [Bordetella sp.]
MKLQNICVYCGSNGGRIPAYADGARELARELVRRDIGLVYGGASVGIMGIVADAVMAEGGRVIGIIPEPLMRKELGHGGLTELHVVQSMHERKTMMAERSDGFVALPGGAGTLEEIFETWTWAQLGMHQKPCGLLNIAGYYDQLAGFLDHSVQESFMRAEHRAMLVVESQPAALLDRYAAYQPPTVSKWIDPGEH